MNDLATYSIEFGIEGMMLEGSPEGAGDRSLRFELKFDATNLEQANALWYEHIEAMFGPDVQTKLKSYAEQNTRR